MRREQLEHVIRAAAALTGEREIVVIGSQAVLGAVPDAPPPLLESMKADVYPLRAPELASVIDGAIGELSPFHERFRYYAHGVGPNTAILPAGWEARLVRVQNENTDHKVGLCVEPHDLAASKLAAGRPKDLAFVETMLAHDLVSPQVVAERAELLPLPDDDRARIAAWLTARATHE